jgi:hypothetical protein
MDLSLLGRMVMHCYELLLHCFLLHLAVLLSHCFLRIALQRAIFYLAHRYLSYSNSFIGFGTLVYTLLYDFLFSLGLRSAFLFSRYKLLLVHIHYHSEHVHNTPSFLFLHQIHTHIFQLVVIISIYLPPHPTPFLFLFCLSAIFNSLAAAVLHPPILVLFPRPQIIQECQFTHYELLRATI